MATGRGRSGRHRYPKRTSIGSFEIHGTEDDARLTVSSDLDRYQFPNQLGSEVEKIVVEEEDGYEYIELHPVSGDEGRQ